ncbi:MAG: M20/M25/M40 family metallo-hydrolase [Nitrospirae bacterium]|nr:M20/M25/M40 family metallo-hydrolase [Nitrospirota bacterium]
MFDDYIRAHQEEIVMDLLNYVSIPSISTTGQSITDAVCYLVGKLEELGFESKVFETGGHPIVYAEIGPEDSGFTLLIYGHYDVFPVEGQKGWKTDPFTPVVDGDRIWGRGTGDNKCQHLAQMYGIAMYNEVIGGLPFRIKLVVEGEEETGSKALSTFVKGNRELLSADVCCYSDGPMFPGDQPVLLLGVRGILCLEFIANGAAQPLHSGTFGGVVPNPAFELLDLFSQIATPSGRLKSPGYNNLPDAALQPEKKAIETLPFDLEDVEQCLGLSPTTGRAGMSYYENLMLRSNFNIAGFKAGYTGEGIKTTIPNQAVAKVDIRLVGNQDPEGLFAEIHSLVAQEYPRITVNKLVSQPPSKTPVTHPLVGVIQRAVSAGFGKQALVVPSLGGTTPDYLFTKVLEIPSIVVPFAPYDENNHAPNESTKISLYLNGIRSTAHVIRELADHLGQSCSTAAQ